MDSDFEKEFRDCLSKNQNVDLSQFVMEHASEIAQAEKIGENLVKALYQSIDEESFTPEMMLLAISHFAGAVVSGIDALGGMYVSAVEVHNTLTKFFAEQFMKELKKDMS